jgi:hypothetical protein
LIDSIDSVVLTALCSERKKKEEEEARKIEEEKNVKRREKQERAEKRRKEKERAGYSSSGGSASPAAASAPGVSSAQYSLELPLAMSEEERLLWAIQMEVRPPDLARVFFLRSLNLIRRNRTETNSPIVTSI